MQLTITAQFKEALDALQKSKDHLFITGKAGTGKSTLLTHYRSQAEELLVVLAPTGVAAVNVGGETIHSFFRFQPNVTPKEARGIGYRNQGNELYTQLDTIIIDEISMVRADLLDSVDTFLRVARKSSLPFGGVRIVMFGDLYQLPPVVTARERETFRQLYPSEWFFDAECMRCILELGEAHLSLIELTDIFRQSDAEFIDLLHRVRTQTIDAVHLRRINERVQPIDTPQKQPLLSLRKRRDPPITLTGRRDTAARINTEHLLSLRGKSKVYEATTSGTFPDGHLPTEEKLEFKVGARVMFVSNDSEGRYVNGTLGTIKTLKEKSVIVAIDGKGEEEIEPHPWELSRTVLNEKKELEKEKVGTFTQLPLMLAWAVTIHKSQGKTFDNVSINLENGAFAHGQTYVALSRCRTLEGITLTHPIKGSDIRMNTRINQFFIQLAIANANELQSAEEKAQRIADAIEMGSTHTISYIQATGEQSEHRIKPLKMAQMQYRGNAFAGLEAIDEQTGKSRIFSMERVLRIF